MVKDEWGNPLNEWEDATRGVKLKDFNILPPLEFPEPYYPEQETTAAVNELTETVREYWERQAQTNAAQAELNAKQVTFNERQEKWNKRQLWIYAAIALASSVAGALLSWVLTNLPG
jgi:hypothetical protein